MCLGAQTVHDFQHEVSTEADLAADVSIFISQNLCVVPALAHKVEAAYNVGVVTIACLHCSLQLKAHKLSRKAATEIAAVGRAGQDSIGVDGDAA